MTSEQINNAVALRVAIEKAGGLASQADLARIWGITRSTANQLCTLDDFPEPVAIIGRSPVYAVDEAVAWRERRHREHEQRRAAA